MATVFDLPLAILHLRNTGRILPTDDCGSCTQTGTNYLDFAKNWRGQSPVPTEQELINAFAEIQIVQPELFDKVKANRKIAKETISKSDPSSIRQRVSLRVIFKIAKGFNLLLANAAAGRIPTRQQVVAWSIPGTDSFEEFINTFGNLIDIDN